MTVPPLREIRPSLWLIIVLVASPAFLLIPITHDAAWQMWVGRQMAHGINLYTEIVEVNPPLWFWMGVPIASLAEAADVRSLSVLVYFFVAAIILSVWLSSRVRAPDMPLWPIVLAMLMPLQHFSQREHFVLISAIPYVLLVAQREHGAEVSPKYAASIGAFAAIGFALKPHFALVPVALEIWAWKAPRLRPETISVAAVAICYSLGLLIFEPDYITHALPAVIAAYDGFAPMRVSTAVWTLLPYLFGTAVVLRARGPAAAFMVASLAFCLVYLIQLKGWGYHALPALGMLLIAQFLVPHLTPVRRTAAFATAVLILLENLKLYETPRYFQFAVPEGTSFGALSVAPRAAVLLWRQRLGSAKEFNLSF